jgi:hypothetical protein
LAKGGGGGIGLQSAVAAAPAVDVLLCVPVLTPKALAACLEVAPQIGAALVRELYVKGLVREVTRRESFRAFAI